MHKINRIKELVELLNHYRNEYYNNQNSEISDFEYDTLFDELSNLESETGFLVATSPTQTVGYEVKSELTKVKHNHPMLSLDKTKDVNDVVKFLDGRSGVVMAKMDGLTCSLRYIDGKLVSAETRGDGETGEDILHCAKTIKNIPLQINCKDEVIVDGEVIISYDDFEKINATLSEDQKYKHPRNLASGSIRQLDSAVAAERNMQFIAWKLIKGFGDNSFFKRWEIMVEFGFDVTPLINLPMIIGDKQHIEHAITLIKQTCTDNGYPIDGCVFGYDDVAYGDSLGATGHHLRSQLAYKFYDELYETKLLDIEWTMGKTSTLTPTAIFETVNIDGTDVSKASLHNISIIKKLGLTNNCTVRVYKANQIIPQIDSCLQDGNSAIEIPKYCPVCGSETEVVTENASEVLMCKNPNCSGKLLGRLKFFVSKPAMNIDGMSEATLEKFLELGWISSFKDIFTLKDHFTEMVKLDGFGEKSATKLLDAIEKSRSVKLENFITALSIPNVGKSAAKTISNMCNGSFECFIQLYESDFDWTELSDFGATMAKNLEDYLLEEYGSVVDLAEEMHFMQQESKAEVKENPFNGKTLCVTGKLNHFTRDSINEKIAELGAKAASSVSKKTDYLITNEASGSSKYKKAVELNVPIITEDEFLAMIKEN